MCVYMYIITYTVEASTLVLSVQHWKFIQCVKATNIVCKHTDLWLVTLGNSILPNSKSDKETEKCM